MSSAPRPVSNRSADSQMLASLVQAAIDVELYTIPLYGTALYSLRGISTESDGTKWPGLRPVPVAADAKGPAADTQRAWNLVYSVYIQEMFHLQLASNLLLALGGSGTFSLKAPVYTAKEIPCVGPVPPEVSATPGAFDGDRLQVFQLIETPDWDATKSGPTPPFDSLPDDFGTIGHLYSAIRWYVNLEYADGTRLFDHMYANAKPQVNQFGTEYAAKWKAVGPLPGSLPYLAKPGMAVTIEPGQDPATARAQANTLIDAIVCEGEGAHASRTVPAQFTPDEQTIERDSGSQGDAAVRAHWDQKSHYRRFQEAAELLATAQTWLSQPLTQSELIPENATPAQRAEAATRFAAYGYAGTQSKPSMLTQAQDLLDSSYTNLLESISRAFGSGTTFPFGAMTGLGSKVTLVWVAAGLLDTTAVPRWKPVTPPTGDGLHACQGLNACKSYNHDTCAGQCECATAVAHSCVASNSCKHQGGCGYPEVEKQGKLESTSPPNLIPGRNSAKGNGGCGAPIPATQVFHNPYNGVDVKDAEGSSIRGDVWERARKLFLADVVPELVSEGKLTPEEQAKLEEATVEPSALRTVLQRT